MHLHEAQKSIEMAMQAAQCNMTEEKQSVSVFESLRKEQLNVMNANWELIRTIVDSGASDTVIPPDCLLWSQLIHTEKVGTEY